MKFINLNWFSRCQNVWVENCGNLSTFSIPVWDWGGFISSGYTKQDWRENFEPFSFKYCIHIHHCGWQGKWKDILTGWLEQLELLSLHVFVILVDSWFPQCFFLLNQMPWISSYHLNTCCLLFFFFFWILFISTGKNTALKPSNNQILHVIRVSCLLQETIQKSSHRPSCTAR